MKSGAAWLLLLGSVCAYGQEPVMPQDAPPQAAQPPAEGEPVGEYPKVIEIAFEGNDTTQDKVMRREMVIQEGDPADPALIERSRQGIQDLGLFKKVSVRQLPVEGGVKLLFSLKEKWYILPFPRVSANLDGQSSYGAELRWNNLFGLNHNLRVLATQSDQKQAGRGKETNYLVRYNAPFLFDSPYGISFATGHSISPVDTPVSYDETFDSFSFVVTRTFSEKGPASQGWTFGAGPFWQNEKRDGPGVPPAYGEATALYLTGSYRDIRFRVYSEEGVAYGLNWQGAREGLISDYNYSALNGYFSRYVAVGETPHQNVNFFVDFGGYFDGPDGVTNYGVGGSSNLRAYDANFIEGNAYYVLATEYVRPIGWPWLRAAAILEAGNAFARPQDISGSRIRTSAALALRLRLQSFVNIEIELGYAVPLDSKGGGRFFGGKI